MSNGDGKPLYRHSGTALLRATAVSTSNGPARWPDLSDIDDCHSWLREVWPDSRLALPIRHASFGLAKQVDAICSGEDFSDKQIRRAALSVVRYFLRLTGRQMPFGLFAGVAPVSVSAYSSARWGAEHRVFIRTDTQWLDDVVSRLECEPGLLDRLDVVFTNLAAQRGDDIDIPHGTTRMLIRRTRPVQAVQELCQSPIQFVALINKLGERFAGASESKIRELATGLVRQGFLITSLRAPMTVTDPLAYVVRRLREVEPDPSAGASTTLGHLEVIAAEIERHNSADTSDEARAAIRTELAVRTRRLSLAGRTSLAADLRLDCDVTIPEHVAVEMSHAGSALIRLTRQPTGSAVWRDYYMAFCDRYGINALVPLTDVVNPETGLGLPATYPGSTLRVRVS
ncbi:lantibiotic dehydratase family protein [Kribbella sp. NPDC056345]|uniref:lantibiotic dehydratase family protein n=1 Tax=Kribbella sp. NPDC056345 TaxID=3345789 RepID=UPI0035E1B822